MWRTKAVLLWISHKFLNFGQNSQEDLILTHGFNPKI